MTKKFVFILLPAIIAVNALKALKLTVMPLWHDESFSALLIRYDLKEMLYRIGLDVHPPLYYLSLKAWSFIFSGSLFSIRMFSVFFGMLTVLALYLLVKKLFQNENLAIFSSVLITLSSFQIQYDMEARMYTLGAFLLVISTYLLIRSLQSEKLRWWLLYSITISAAIYTHYYAFFWIFAQGIFVIYWLIKNKGKNLKFCLLAYALGIILYFPWLSIFLRQLNQVQENYWIESMNIWSIPNTFLNMTIGTSTDPNKLYYLLLFLIIVLLWAIIFFVKKLKNDFKWLILSLLLIPFFLSTLLSFKTAIYLDRYFIFSLPFYLIFLTATIFLIKNERLKKTLIVLAVLTSLISFPARWLSFGIEKKPGMGSAAEFLNSEVKNNDKIFVGSSFAYFTFKYYNETGINPLLYAPGDLPHFSGTALLSEEDIISDFQESVKKNDIVWLINTTGFGNYQPRTPDSWIKIDEKGFEDTYDYRGWVVISKYLAD